MDLNQINITEGVATRFISAVKVTADGCWIWQNGTATGGRGLIRAGATQFYAHHLSFRMFRGPRPSSSLLASLCPNKECVNPFHFESVDPESSEKPAVIQAKYEVTSRERFWSKVEKSEGGCWSWSASCNMDGYGQFLYHGKMCRSHRIAYTWIKGEIPVGFELDHVCRNRKCVNPEHLEAVDHRTNSIRAMIATGVKAGATHCVNGHPFNDANTGIRKTGSGRYCKVCSRRSGDRSYEKHRVAISTRRLRANKLKRELKDAS